MAHENTNVEEYLEAILRLASPNRDPLCRACAHHELEEVRPSEVAELMEVTRPSTTSALDRLEAAGYIERVKKKIHLTEAGFLKAYSVLKRHRVAEEFLTKVFGFDSSTVHEEACELEHAISDRMLKRMEEMIKQLEDSDTP